MLDSCGCECADEEVSMAWSKDREIFSVLQEASQVSLHKDKC